MSDPDETRLPTTAGGATVARGIQRVWDPRIWGTVVGAAGATVFVLSNRNDLEGRWPTVARLAWTPGSRAMPGLCSAHAMRQRRRSGTAAVGYVPKR